MDFIRIDLETAKVLLQSFWQMSTIPFQTAILVPPHEWVVRVLIRF